MCLYPKQANVPATLEGKAKQHTVIADKDLVCYKGFDKRSNGVLYTPHRGYRWPKDKTVKVSKFGLRSNGSSFEVHEGLHAGMTRSVAKANGHHVEKMIIPKGTPYILGSNGDVVALAMRIAGTPKKKKKDGIVAKKKAAKKKK